MTKFMDPLADDSSPSSGSDSEAEQGAKRPRPAAKPQPELDLEALANGASVLFVPEPKQDAESNWEWGSGAAHKEAGGDEETLTREGREATREAVSAGLDASVEQAFHTAQRAAELREAKRREHSEKQKDRRATYQQREKRKRDLGMQKSGKNFVEEEKRLARNHGVYSGFDT